jgi:hypothetical protein
MTRIKFAQVVLDQHTRVEALKVSQYLKVQSILECLNNILIVKSSKISFDTLENYCLIFLIIFLSDLHANVFNHRVEVSEAMILAASLPLIGKEPFDKINKILVLEYHGCSLRYLLSGFYEVIFVRLRPR